MINHLKPYIDRLRLSGLRPTKQRLAICKVLFDRKDTFHFTIEKLKKKIEKNVTGKISLATVYNTVHSFKKNGYLKEIPMNCNQIYFDTNISHHHHFFDLSTNQLLDMKDSDVGNIKIKKNIPGKKIKSIEVLVKIANNN